jgi:stress-induced-phosphoprotein 1
LRAAGRGGRGARPRSHSIRLRLSHSTPSFHAPPAPRPARSAAKAEGNAAQAKGDFDAAIAAYTRAIAADPSDHVFFSNRSASLLSKGDAEGALADAEACVKLNAGWSKGYSRVGAALFKLGRLEDAAKAYKDGLAVERSAALAEGLEEVEAALAARQRRAAGPAVGGNLSSLFGPAFFARVAANPKLAPYLQDKDFMAKLMGLAQDPTALIAAMGMGGAMGGGMPAAPPDPRIAEVLQFAFSAAGRGGAGGAGGEFGEEGEEEEEEEEGGAGGAGSGMRVERPAPPPAQPQQKRKPAPLEPQAAPPPSDETPEEAAARKAREQDAARARARKEEGNAAYKARRFDEALVAYREAAALDPRDMTYLLNEASVHFECKRWDECEAACVAAVDKGREVGAPFAVFAKAYARRGNVAAARGDLERAVELYEQAQLEQRTDEVGAKLKKARVDLKALKEKAYQDPAEGAAAKERGNVAFKAGQWAEAIKQYSDAIARDPGNATYYQNRATAQAKVMNYGGALEDCERALKIDPKFVKALNRKGNCQVALKEYHKALDSFRAALALEPENGDAREGLRLTGAKINEGGAAMDEERAQRAREDPDIQMLLRDPMVSAALEDLQRDQASARKVMADPIMRAKIEKLIGAQPAAPRARGTQQVEAGFLRTRTHAPLASPPHPQPLACSARLK